MATRGSISTLVACLGALAMAAQANAQLNTTTSTTTANTTTSSVTTTVTNAASQPTTHVIEWDLTSMSDQLDGNPGAMVVDTRGEDDNRLWFVTRLGGETASPQKVYRFIPPRSLKAGNATWTSWELQPTAFLGGGITKMRPSHDRRFLFVRMPADDTVSTIQRIDTVATSRTVWSFGGDAPLVVSDIAVDDKNHVFTTGVSSSDSGGYVQMLDTSTAPPLNATNPNVPVTRWIGLDGAGQCISTDFDPAFVNPGSGVCNAGIDVHPSKQNLVYFVEKGEQGASARPESVNGFITELNLDPRAAFTNPTTGQMESPVRRWSLAQLSTATGDNIFGPRVLKIDRSGKVWITTDSGHLVSLDPNNNRMTKHKVPGRVTPDGKDVPNDLFGLSPDSDVIGYTAALANKVAMLFPKFTPVLIAAIPCNDTTTGAFPCPVRTPFTAAAATVPTATFTDSVPGDAKIAPVKTTRNPNEGTFVEALVDEEVSCDGTQKPTSMTPLGITANWSKAQGTFFYTVGTTVATNANQVPVLRRVGHVRLPNKEKLKFARDDDDADEGFNASQCPGFHAAETGDADADGVPDQYDTASGRENMTSYDPAAVPAMSSSDYPASTSASSLALIATAQADVATATIAVDVYNAVGTLVGTSGPMIGAAAVTVPAPGAGNFTVRVRNLSGSSVSSTPSIIVRDTPPMQ
jgi:hypothetical protein